MDVVIARVVLGGGGVVVPPEHRPPYCLKWKLADRGYDGHFRNSPQKKRGLAPTAQKKQTVSKNIIVVLYYIAY